MSAGVFCILVGAGATSAQDAKGERVQAAGEGVKLPPWIVTCSNANAAADLACVMQQSLLLASTGQRVATVTIQKADAGTVAILQLPHGIRLPAGVEVSIDDRPGTRLDIESADESGSYARFVLDDAAIKAMQAGSLFKISATALSGDTLTLELSLGGFSKAYDYFSGN